MPRPDATDGAVPPDAEDGLPGVRNEPEPDWVEAIRRGRQERAERLKSLLDPLEQPHALEPIPTPGEAEPTPPDEVPGAGKREPPA